MGHELIDLYMATRRWKHADVTYTNNHTKRTEVKTNSPTHTHACSSTHPFNKQAAICSSPVARNRTRARNAISPSLSNRHKRNLDALIAKV